MNPIDLNPMQGIMFWQFINALLSAGVLAYVMRTENRLTKLETKMEMVVQLGFINNAENHAGHAIQSLTKGK